MTNDISQHSLCDFFVIGNNDATVRIFRSLELRDCHVDDQNRSRFRPMPLLLRDQKRVEGCSSANLDQFLSDRWRDWFIMRPQAFEI
jgi:hypothetical protein